MWDRVPDVINYVKFELDRFRAFGAPGGRKSLSPIDWSYRPYRKKVISRELRPFFKLS